MKNIFKNRKREFLILLIVISLISLISIASSFDLFDNKNILKVTDVAEMLGVSKWTIYKWVSEKRFPLTKVGGLNKFRKDDILEWISNNSFMPANKARNN